MKHKALEDRIDFDDPFDLASEYQPGERRHGTAMASLVIHGDRSDNTAEPIRSKVHHVAIIQPDPDARRVGEKKEHFPEDCFYEDRIARAVRRMLEKDGEIEPQAPTIKVINLSVGDSTRPFLHTLSPWARLLDWFSWKYRVLFCVSAGNYDRAYDFGISYSEYESKNSEEKVQILLESMQDSLSSRRLLAPAESINALTVGALHWDESGDGYYLGDRVDLLPDNKVPSPITRLGHGFRRSIKPEIYFPGGRQLYKRPPSGKSTVFKINNHLIAPGQKTAWDSEEGALSEDAFNRGTSNAAALATRTGVRIHEVLSELNNQNPDIIPDELIAVLIKTLLVHGSIQNGESKASVGHLKNSNNSRTFKTVLARYLGYGAVNVERVLACTEQRGTVIGFGEITVEEIHEYRFPVPAEFGGQRMFRRMVVTLAWFSPINPGHRYFREAKLEIKSASKWDETPLRLKRVDSDHNQNKRGTVQHEVLEGKSELREFQQNEEIVLQVICKKDATEKLEEKIPYGLAVTLEVAEESEISVYEKVRQRLLQQIGVQEEL
ncbi:MAG: S8 family peptidase [Candidatus Dadabacteria bacterium]|nr:S8 family peptidase [Candidatus Dadabacteria bacterium]